MPVDGSFALGISHLLVVPVEGELCAVKSTLTGLPGGVEAWRPQQLYAMEFLAVHQQLGIHLTRVDQMKTGQQPLAGQGLMNAGSATYVLSGGRSGMDMGNETR